MDGEGSSFGIHVEGEAVQDDPAMLEREDVGRSCIVVGPANAGKTTLLLSLQQACLQDGSDEFNLDFVPESESTLALSKLSTDFLFRGKTPQASREIAEYAFRIFVENRHRQEPEYYCKMSVTDGPGGYLLPSERTGVPRNLPEWQKLLAAAQGARSLVLCVDACKPSLEVLHNGLPKFILDVKAGNRKLPQQRILLLLTKFDRVIAEFTKQAGNWADELGRRGRDIPAALSPFGGIGSRPLTPSIMADRLSPLGQAQAQLGQILTLLRSSLHAHATLAVGLCSAFGFSELTYAHSTSEWREQRPYGDRSVAEKLREWRPFGVREALLFLSADAVRHPVQLVPPRTLGPDFNLNSIAVPLG